ncbi:MAG: hypothetical protein IT371_20405 [Deltaproteobacteria bacterium]|nr:hypothetical protein [Deltaproteobacteria bacterium]
MKRRALPCFLLGLLAAGCGEDRELDRTPSTGGSRDGGAGVLATRDGGPRDQRSHDGDGARDGARDGAGDGAGDGAFDGAAVASCLSPLPSMKEASPPTPADTCDWMDWNLSTDGFYLISQFGTTADDTTMGRGTSCSGLLVHYMNWCCMYDQHQKACVDGQTPQFLKCHSWKDPHLPKIPWIKGTVDYAYGTVVNRVWNYFYDRKGNLKPAAETMNFPYPEYFYVAGAQRFGCGTTLRVTNTENGRCVVAYVEDGGPGSAYEQAGRGGRRILDSSPALHRYLGNKKSGWANSSLLHVEWGLPGDRPGQPCTPCQSTPAKRGTEDRRSIYDINHYEGARAGAGCR